MRWFAPPFSGIMRDKSRDKFGKGKRIMTFFALKGPKIMLSPQISQMAQILFQQRITLILRIAMDGMAGQLAALSNHKITELHKASPLVWILFSKYRASAKALRKVLA